eukprot:2272775-Amphidinium_carterae.1
MRASLANASHSEAFHACEPSSAVYNSILTTSPQEPQQNRQCERFELHSLFLKQCCYAPNLASSRPAFK